MRGWTAYQEVRSNAAGLWIYVESKNYRLTRRNFKSNEECQAFIASLRADEGELSKVDPDAEAKAEQTAVDFAHRVGLGRPGGSEQQCLKEESAYSLGQEEETRRQKEGTEVNCYTV
ncbi:hypothetical protein THAOC_18881 [Thalassiosira oceanica]|uniref:Uncharacterized protein n=1 Tax=Thalassiosira oceanica TaxID=159749 RepID=K0SQZ5_THAOC|nr:hypothetical protein THAOC_18881 [Thalassiosira oceanica]|eukprot:EJK60717.1 hypothetical protein THAOC_18881 [Thalassiosira oceanica]